MASTQMFSKVRSRLFGSIKLFDAACRSTRPATLLHKIPQRQPLLLPRHQVFFCSAAAPSSDASLKYRYGRLVLEVPLPSRKEKCLFFLKPMLMSVGDLIADLQKEDHGIQTASVFSKDGARVANTTLLDALLDKDFQLVINDVSYHVQTPALGANGGRREHAMEMGDVKHVVHLLHTALHLPDHHVLQERHLLERLDSLKQQLSPLETVKAELALKAESQSSRALWGGMALLSVQGGALAWLTWWVYSWDVMEPVTYFITYGTSLGIFAYCVLANQDYIYPAAKDRQFLNYFYKGAKKRSFNVEQYNSLRDELTQVQEDLKRLQSSTQLQLPIQQIQPKP
ncbi:calcium uniporter protein, mitochondrial [Gadus macrocephalus]|uniref:calcium uniporter protein, mitochondrial n=1 Tax=Gadus macrocephalus TaxID=80720 RepID=UPI0028CBBCE6|nr:calcium uniporter protein, mitochondrial [Gadus macrocephalus]